MSAEGSDRTARWLLALGAGLGIGLAGFSLARSAAPTAADAAGAVALVNGEPISREVYERFAAAVAAERPDRVLEPAERHRLLERLVDEELLLQRALALGLARHEPTARRAVVASLITSITTDAEAVEPDETTLRRFYAEAADRFRRPGRVALDVVLVATAGRSEAEARERALRAAERLRAGETIEGVRAELGDPPGAELPPGPLSLTAVREYLGPSAARAAETLAPTAVSDPVRGAPGYHVIRLRERTEAEVAPFEEVAGEVRVEYLRSLGEQALRDYLAGLRDEAELVVLLPELDAE